MPFYTYDWAASNRSNRYFYDLYGVYSNADGAASTVADSGIMKASAKAVSRASTGIVGTCPSCKQYSLQGTYVSTTHTSRGHAEYYEGESGIIKPHISWAAQSFLCRFQTQKGMEKPQI